MFGPRPERVASELFRVVRPGGTVGMANWLTRGFQAEVFKVLDKYGPSRPAELPDPRLWGEEEVVRERLGGLASSIVVESRMLPWEFDSFAAMAALFRDHGPSGIRELPEDQLAAMVAETQALIERWNQASDGSVRIEAEYTLVVARKRG
jgi:hypothetical protein